MPNLNCINCKHHIETLEMIDDNNIFCNFNNRFVGPLISINATPFHRKKDHQDSVVKVAIVISDHYCKEHELIDDKSMVTHVMFPFYVINAFMATITHRIAKSFNLDSEKNGRTYEVTQELIDKICARMQEVTDDRKRRASCDCQFFKRLTKRTYNSTLDEITSTYVCTRCNYVFSTTVRSRPGCRHDQYDPIYRISYAPDRLKVTVKCICHTCNKVIDNEVDVDSQFGRMELPDKCMHPYTLQVFSDFNVAIGKAGSYHVCKICCFDNVDTTTAEVDEKVQPDNPTITCKHSRCSFISETVLTDEGVSRKTFKCDKCAKLFFVALPLPSGVSFKADAKMSEDKVEKTVDDIKKAIAAALKKYVYMYNNAGMRDLLIDDIDAIIKSYFNIK